MISTEKAKLQRFSLCLSENEKSKSTIDKYTRDVAQFLHFLGEREATKCLLLEYRGRLQERNKPQTVNAKLSAIHAYLNAIGLPHCKVKLMKVQRKVFLEESRELSEPEYKQLLNAAQSRSNERLYLVMLSICSTGIRVSELKYITLEAVRAGQAEITLKGKSRTVLLPRALKSRLLFYAAKNGIQSGHIFRTKNGKPLDRSNICHDMKRLCQAAHVEPQKVFPHNLRHLFARCFYAVEKNLAHLADILGHSSVETTRIYVAASARAFERTLQKMRLLI